MTLEAVQNALDALRITQQQRYPLTVFEVNAAQVHDQMTLAGEVLVAKQRHLLLKEMARLFPEQVFDDQVSVLSEQSTQWHEVVVPCVNLYSSPDPAGTLVSQARAGEWVNCVLENKGYHFVTMEDSAQGWVENTALGNTATQSNPWSAPTFLQGEKVQLESAWQAGLMQAARKELGKPYLLGGRSAETWDCSSLVQQLYFLSTNHLLPRHSWDQKDYGEPILPEEMQVGDLVFALSKQKGHKHVALAIGNDQLIHATLHAHKVVRWPLAGFQEVYQIVLVRRLVA